MIRELRHAFRGLLKSPIVFFATVMILAAGIGANTAVFSAFNQLLIRPLPFRNSAELAIFGEINQQRGIRAGVSREKFEDWAEHSQSFQALGALLDDQVFPLPGNRECLHGARVSTNFFDVLGVRPALGRLFVAQDGRPGSENVAIITDELWSTRWARDPGVLGRTLEMSNRKWAIVGVLPPRFRMLYSTASVWVPLEPESARGTRALFAIGRLRFGGTVQRASAELSAVQTSSEPGWAAWGKPLRDYVVGERRPLVTILLLTVALMLATACMNVSAVLVARATGRLKDVAIRISLGAGPWRIVRESLAEAMILAATGSIAGLLLAVAIQKVIVAALPEVRDFTIDRTVLAFTLALTLCATALMTCGPALVSSRARQVAAARNGARVRGVFVVAQTTLAVALLVSAGVLLRSLATLQATDPGFRSDGIIVAELNLAGTPTPLQSGAFVRTALEMASLQPNVRSAAAATAMPLFSPERTTIEVKGRGVEEAPTIALRSISPEYFTLFGVPMHRGRQFSKTDDASSPRVAIVNLRAAELIWPGSEALGQQIRCAKGEWRTVVGVVANIRSVGLRRPPMPEVFTPFAQDPTTRVSLALRVDGDPIASMPALSQIITAVDPRAEVSYKNSMPALLDEQLALVRALSIFGSVFAGIALLLAGTGLYGAISCLYAQRTKEIGIRMALGATPRAIIHMVAASSARLAAMGCLAGVIVGAAVGRLFQAAVFGAGSVDPVVLAAPVAVTGLIVIVATYAPAARASGIEPAAAIRCE